MEMLRSLEGSLRRLGRPSIDALLIHEPLGEIPDCMLHDLHETAERLKHEGKIRNWGVAGPRGSWAFMEDDPRLDILQAPIADLPVIYNRRAMRVAYGLYKSYSALPDGQRSGFVAFAKMKMRELDASMIVTTRRAGLLPQFRDFF